MKMKNLFRLLLGLVLAAAPLSVCGQTTIQEAFDRVIQGKSVKSSSKEIQSHNDYIICRLTLPAKTAAGLIEEMQAAFDMESGMSYQFVRNKSGRDAIRLAVGDGFHVGIAINSLPGGHYTYACFLAPQKEDPEGIHRYAYALNWVQQGDQTTVRLIRTYATTQMYRQQQLLQQASKQFRPLGDLKFQPQGDLSKLQQWSQMVLSDDTSWFSTFVFYVRGLEDAQDPTMRQAVATRIYEHSKLLSDKSAPERPKVTSLDKKTAREILSDLIEEHQADLLVKRLLNASLVNLR